MAQIYNLYFYFMCLAFYAKLKLRNYMALIFDIYSESMQQSRRKVEKHPLLYSLAEGVLLEELGSMEDEKNQISKAVSSKCAQQFVAYIKSVDFDRDYGKAQKINESIDNYYSVDEKQKPQDEEFMRNMIQALSFNLTPEQAYEIFPKAMMAEVPIQRDNDKKTGKIVYEQMYKLLNP